MSQVTKCPHCSQKLKVPASGGMFACPGCGRKLKFGRSTSNAESVADSKASLEADHPQPGGLGPEDQPQAESDQSVESAPLRASDSRQTALFLGMGIGVVVLAALTGVAMFFAFRDSGSGAATEPPEIVAAGEVPDERAHDAKPIAKAPADEPGQVQAVPADDKVAGDDKVAANARVVEGEKKVLAADKGNQPDRDQKAGADAGAAGGGVARKDLPQFDRAKNPTTLERSCEATALVVTSDGTGSAFCIDEQGVFITNAHVVEGLDEGDEVSLVLRSGTEKEMKVRASVARISEDVDLAVLTVIGDHGRLTKLPLGDTSKLKQTDEIMALGFPFGEALAVAEDANPSISVNLGRVTSLRVADGKLKVIQVDAQVNPGNSGGPVTNKAGEVVGVVVSGVQNSGVNFVIPVDEVRTLLERPVVTLRIPNELADGQRKHRVEAVVSGLPWIEDQDYQLALIVRSGQESQRLAMEKRRDRYVVDVQFAKDAAAVPGIHFTADFQDKEITGSLVQDVTIMVKGEAVKIADVRSITRRESGICVVKQKNGKSIAGRLRADDLNAVEVRLADGRKVILDLSRARMLEFPEPPSGLSVELVLEVRDRDGRAVAVLTRSIGVEQGGADGPRVIAGRNKKGDWRGQRRIRLPGVITDVCIGGGGRYMVCTIPDGRHAVVIDLAAGKVAHYVQLASEMTVVAAGQKDLITIDPLTNTATRFNLANGKQVLQKQLKLDRRVELIGLGSDSKGPALLGSGPTRRSGLWFLDVEKLRTVTVTTTGRVGSLDIRLTGQGGLRTSADGSTWGYYRWGYVGVNVLRLSGKQLQIAKAPLFRGYIIPSPDGRYLYTALGMYANRAIDQEVPKPITSGLTLPAVNGNLFIRIGGIDLARAHNPQATLYIEGTSRPLATLPGIEPVFEGELGETFLLGRTRLTLDKRIILSPAFGVLATTFKNYVDVVPFDLHRLLRDGGTNYLVVDSQPKRRARAGEPYQYRLQVLSKAGGVTYRLDAGPDGMKVTADGVVKWMPTRRERGRHHVVITVIDRRQQESLHSFAIDCK